MPLYDSTPSYIEHDVHTNRYLLLVEKNDFFLPLTRLLGYALSAPTVDFSNPVTVPQTIFTNGQIFTLTKTIRGQAARMYTFPLGFPAGNWIMTPLGRLTENLAKCERDYYLAYLCPDEDCKSHFWVLPDATLSPLEPGDMITIGDDAQPIEATSQLSTTTPWLYYYIEVNLVQAVAGEEYHAVAFCQDECDECEEPNISGVYGGYDGANGVLYSTDDQFRTGTDITPPTPPLPAGSYITGLYCKNDNVIAVYADSPDMAAAASGGIVITTDDGANWAAGVEFPTGAAITDAFADIFLAEGYYHAIGKAGVIWRSVDGVNWEQVANTVTTGTTDFYQGAYDPSTGLVWIAGWDPGVSGVAVVLKGTTIIDYTALVNPGVNAIYSVQVLDDDHVIYGLGDGTLREHQNASDADAADTFRVVLSGAAGEIRGIEGDRARTIAFVGSDVVERSALTEREFTQMDLSVGTVVNGVFQDSAAGNTKGGMFPGYNYFVGVTDQGEIVYIKPCYTFETS